ncbi:transcription factor IIA subunit alpha [Pyricularia oryzae]
MSNAVVGTVYEQIIKGVMEASRTDFEDNGFGESEINELQQVWQQKLTTMGAASFPWDPKPDAPTPPPPPAQADQHRMPPTANYTQATLSPPTAAQPGLALPRPNPPANNGVQQKKDATIGEPAIKLEPGTQPVGQFAPPAGNATNIAQQRAMQNIANYAAANNMMQSGAQAQQQRMPMPMPMPPAQAQQQQQQQQPQLAQQQAYQQHQQQIPSNPQQQMQPPQQPQNGSLGQSQTDGPAHEEDTWEAVMMRRNADGSATAMGRVEVDRMLHAKIAAQAKAMEGGGLMVPLKQVKTKKNKDRRRRAAPQATITGPSTSGGSVPQVDGPDDDDGDEDLDDAINSDLDDDNEPDESDEDGDELQQQMLCLYDKVQRVKNKWKCTLKDGVLCVNGKEYVFHKATGEYEW